MERSYQYGFDFDRYGDNWRTLDGNDAVLDSGHTALGLLDSAMDGAMDSLTPLLTHYTGQQVAEAFVYHCLIHLQEELENPEELDD